MTPAIVANLHPPRLPEAFAALGWPELLAGVGIGLMLAALIVTLAAPALRRRPRRITPRARIAAAALLPPEERLLALTHLLHDRGGTLPEDQRAALYSGQGGDPARIEALILAGRRR